MTPRIDIEDMTDAQDEAPERIWADRSPFGEHSWMDVEYDGGTLYVRSDLARPSQAGVIRPLRWIDDTESKCTRAYAPALGGKMMVVELDPGSGEYSAGIDLSGLCFRFVLDTYHDGLGAFTAPAKFPSIEAAKSAAQADYEARVSSSLVETVGLEALVSFARPFADALDIECDFMTPPAPFEDSFDVRRGARAALAAMDTLKGGEDEG